jgi:predicted Zn-dependent peptidase
MTSYNATNERMKRQYFAYLAEAQGHSEQSIDAVAKAISRFETYTRYKDFKAFHIEQAKAFKRDLANQRGGLFGSLQRYRVRLARGQHQGSTGSAAASVCFRK